MTSARQRFNPIDRFLRRRRASALARFVPEGSRVLDVGCGLDNWLVRSSTGWHHDSVGIDPDLPDALVGRQGRRATVDEVADTDPGAFDVVTSLAVIEHLPTETVEGHLRAIADTLRPHGRLVLTTPTPRSKPVLEFLAFRLRVISAHEIRDHRHYYGADELVALLAGLGWRDVDHAHFQFGLNQRVVAVRPIADVDRTAP